jgi:hypothetical protein
MNSVSRHAPCRFNAKWRKPRTSKALDTPPRAGRADRIALALVVAVIALASGCLRRRAAATEGPAVRGATARHKRAPEAIAPTAIF